MEERCALQWLEIPTEHWVIAVCLSMKKWIQEVLTILCNWTRIGLERKTTVMETLFQASEMYWYEAEGSRHDCEEDKTGNLFDLVLLSRTPHQSAWVSSISPTQNHSSFLLLFVSRLSCGTVLLVACLALVLFGSFISIQFPPSGSPWPRNSMLSVPMDWFTMSSLFMSLQLFGSPIYSIARKVSPHSTYMVTTRLVAK